MTSRQDNSKTDPFSRAVRDKLAGCELPVDERCWAEIEARLDGRRRKAVPLRVWLAGVAAVAAAVCLLVWLPPFRPADAPPQQVARHDVSVERPAPLPAGQEPVPATAQAETAPMVAMAEQPASTVVSPRPRQAANTPQPEQPAATDTPQADEPQSAPVAGSSSARPSQPAPAAYGRDDAARREYLPPVTSRKRQGGWHLAVAVQGGGGRLAEQRNLLAYAPRTSSFLENADDASGAQASPWSAAGPEPEPKAGYLRMVDGRSFSRITHLPPLAAGLRVRKDLGRHFALETGLTYTYLQSRMADEQIVQRDAELQMHYLGIPLSAVVYLVDRPRWSVYFLAGGMVEKGVQGTYRETVRTPGLAPEVTTETGRIAGVQWSLNASAGIEYRLYRSFSVYLEPNVFYYLKNNQPLSVRAENPLIVGLNAGVRITLHN